ncbi:acetyl-lysine deacetylase [Streptomyces sp. AC1-42T]|nr:acetyl-lysine deacetylase [Streptomyces sp. AC1-42T]
MARGPAAALHGHAGRAHGPRRPGLHDRLAEPGGSPEPAAGTERRHADEGRRRGGGTGRGRTGGSGLRRPGPRARRSGSTRQRNPDRKGRDILTTHQERPRERRLTDHDAVALLAEVVAIPSVSGSEQKLAERLRDFAAGFGAESHLDEVGNVHAVVGRGTRTVMLLSHLDTVAGDVPYEHGEHLVRGRGAADAKGALTAMLVAALTSRHLGLRVHWVGVVEEETLWSRGAEYVRTSVPVPDAVIVGEPSGASSVTIGYKGMVELEARCEVARTHTATPGPKSSEILVRALARLFDRYGTRGNDRFGDVGMVVRDGRFEPFSSVCSLVFRTPPGTSPEELRRDVAAVLGEAVGVSAVYDVPAVVVARDSVCVRALSRAIALRGQVPNHKLKTGTSDMNTLSRSWRVPMATYGPGDSRQDHTDDEHILIREYLDGTHVLRAALGELDRTLPEAAS